MTDQNGDDSVKGWAIGLGTVLALGVVGTAVGVGVWAAEEDKKKNKHKRKHKGKHKGNHNPHGGGGLGPGHVPPHGHEQAYVPQAAGAGPGSIASDPFNGKPFMETADPVPMGAFSPLDRVSPYEMDGANKNYDSDRMGEYDPFEDDEMDVRRLMPAGGGWRGDTSCSGEDDLDTTAFGRWGPKAKAFRDFISVGGSARYGINTRTKSPVGGAPQLRDILVGSAPTPLSTEAILFSDSSHRQDLVFEQTGKYPELRQ